MAVRVEAPIQPDRTNRYEFTGTTVQYSYINRVTECIGHSTIDSNGKPVLILEHNVDCLKRAGLR